MLEANQKLFNNWPKTSENQIPAPILAMATTIATKSQCTRIGKQKRSEIQLKRRTKHGGGV